MKIFVLCMVVMFPAAVGLAETESPGTQEVKLYDHYMALKKMQQTLFQRSPEEQLGCNRKFSGPNGRPVSASRKNVRGGCRKRNIVGRAENIPGLRATVRTILPDDSTKNPSRRRLPSCRHALFKLCIKHDSQKFEDVIRARLRPLSIMRPIPALRISMT